MFPFETRDLIAFMICQESGDLKINAILDRNNVIKLMLHYNKSSFITFSIE